jgi:protein-ribulosamine 3-kinase
MHLPAHIRSAITTRAGMPGAEFHPVGGGSINRNFLLSSPGSSSVFCKLNSATKFPQLFITEARGLQSIGKTGAIRVPEASEPFIVDDYQVLLLEYIEASERTPAFWTRFGESLAAMHAVTAPLFGSMEDNYMGSVPQSNDNDADWNSFFRRNRLEPLARMCRDEGLLDQDHMRALEKIYDRLPEIFGNPGPSLVHGDLWSGNFLCGPGGQPVLIDPAVYYGHRSIDLAMTTLFGGFGERFYSAYNSIHPFPSNFREQWAICNLYPLLIHLKLFGSMYRKEIEKILGM